MKWGIITTFLLVLVTGIAFQNCSDVDFSANQKPNPPDGGGTGQGNPPPPPVIVSGEFNKTFNTTSDKVDILIVDDNSGSMSEKQKNLASRFQDFVLNLGSIDWQIAVTSTDVCEVGSTESLCKSSSIDIEGARGRFFGDQGTNPLYGNLLDVNILRPTTPNVSTLFGNIVQRNGEQGSGDERGIYAANLTIDNRNTTTSGFFRDGADLAIIVVSDEDERSVGDRATATNTDQRRRLEEYDLPETLIKKVNDTWMGSKSLLINSIVITGEPGCGKTTDANYGSVYVKASKLTNGVIGCSTDDGAGAYTKMITNIGSAIQKLNLNITLNHTPISEPVVTWTPAGNAVPITWKPGTNTLVMSSYPLSGTQIKISYQYQQ